MNPSKRTTRTTPALWSVPRTRKSVPKIITTDAPKRCNKQMKEHGPGPVVVVEPITPIPRDSTRHLKLELARLKGADVPKSDTSPNWQDARNERRAKSVLYWAVRQGLATRRISHGRLDKVFGQQQNPVSEYLRRRLLVSGRGHNKDAHKSKEWSINQRGLANVWLEVRGTELDLAQHELDAWRQVLHLGPYEYSEPTPGGRRYHELQQVPRRLRSVLFPGAIEYDLSAANVTLVSQRAKELNTNLRTPYLDKYLTNKTAFRQAIATQFKVSAVEAKELFQAIFSLAHMVPSEWSLPYSIMDSTRYHSFVCEPVLQALRLEIVECWRALLPKSWAAGAERFRAYELLEREVMNAVELQLTGQYLLQHDGFLWLGPDRLDPDDLAQRVQGATGYSVVLEETRL